MFYYYILSEKECFKLRNNILNIFLSYNRIPVDSTKIAYPAAHSWTDKTQDNHQLNHGKPFQFQ